MENKVLPIKQPSMCIFDNLSNNRVAGTELKSANSKTL